MIKIEQTEVLGWEHAIRGMRNPKNSWDKSDSSFFPVYETPSDYIPEIGENDKKLMKTLAKAGTDHRKYMRMITVYADITAPFYWWKEYDTYKVGTVANSCSTMHKITDKEFSLDDFSVEHIVDMETTTRDYSQYEINCLFKSIVDMLNDNRTRYLKAQEAGEDAETLKKYWWRLIQLLPTSYNQKRTVMLNYEVLANMYKSRKNHKLDEWHDFCRWVESLPYSWVITGKE